MKNSIKMFFAAFVLVAAVSCVKENLVDDNQGIENVETISAPFYMTAPRAVSEAPVEESEAPVEENDPDSKTGLAEDGSTVVWKSGDKVDAVIWSADNSSATDAVVAEMTCDLDTDKEEDVFFVGSFSNGSNAGDYFRPTDSDGNFLDSDSNFSTASMAVYPSTVTYSKSGTTRVYSYDLPHIQTPVAGTFQDDVALLSAYFNKSTLIGKYSNFRWSPAPGVPELIFKNACGLVKVVLPEFEYDIVSVKVEGTEPMAGQPANLSETDGRLVPNGSWTAPYTYVELANSDNSAIAADTYYMVVWPGTHSKLTLTVTDERGWTWTKEVEGTFDFVESKVFDLNINAANADFADPNARVDNSDPEVGKYYYTDGTISLYHDLEGKTLAGVIFSVGDDYSNDTDLITALGEVTGLVVCIEQYSGALTSAWYNNTVYGSFEDAYKGYTATNNFETASEYKVSGYLYAHNQTIDEKYSVKGGWYIPGKHEFNKIVENLSVINTKLQDAGALTITDNYWISYKRGGYSGTDYYGRVYYLSSSLSYYTYDVVTNSKNARLICAFYKQKEWTPGEVTGVTLDHTSADMVVGEGTLTLTHTLSVYGDVAATNSNVAWTSSNEGVATVSDGIVTAVGAGTATITVTTEDGGFEAMCTVSVTDPNARNYAAVGDYVYNDGTWSDGTEDPTEGKTVAGIVCYIGNLSADTELMALNSNYNVIVAELSDYGGTNGKQIYEGQTGDNHFWIGYNESKVDEYNRVTSQPGDKFFGYSLFYSWKICYEKEWGAVKNKLMYGYDINDVITSASTCWYVASLGEYKAIRAMEQISGLKLSGYTNLGNGEYATLYLDDSNGYVYDYNPITGAISTKTGKDSYHWIRRVFATTLANHE